MKHRRLRPEIDIETMMAIERLEEEGRFEEAIEVYRPWAIAGDTTAQLNLSTLLDDHLIPPRPAEAVYWLKRAIKLGDGAAAWSLAMHYKNEDKDRWYLFWLRKAAQMGEEEALEMLEIHEAFEHARMTFVPAGNDEGGAE